ncbi:hypothetical protein K1719_009160 [Acacia pycnantha]|nr:hypothetical protein K1719_009160 [Acacia pycnantha]
MSDFHPESWNPMWSVSSILTGLLSFMVDTSPTTGSVSTTIEEKRRLAKSSLAFNCKNATFRKMFPEYVDKYNQRLSEQAASEQMASEVASRDKSSRPMLRKVTEFTGEDMKVAAGELKEVRKNRKQSLPTWMMFLLFSIFGLIMALPLLQL